MFYRNANLGANADITNAGVTTTSLGAFEGYR
jgi:hypothetical protein